MLWRTSPAATELEEVALGWLRRLIGLPDAFEGVIYDTASVSTLHALAAAREAAVPDVRAAGLAGPARHQGRARVLRRARAYVGRQGGDPAGPRARRARRGSRRTRSSACGPSCWRAAIAARSRGGSSADRRRRDRRQHVEHQRRSGRRDRGDLRARAASGCTSTPRMPASPRWCRATSGSCAAPDEADSIVVNPHKWLFTPFDLSVLYCRRMDVLRQAFALTPEYLKTSEGDAGVQKPDGHRHPARTPVPRAEALDDHAALRRRGAARPSRRAHAARAAVRRLGRRQRSLRTRRAGALQRRLLPPARRRDRTTSTSACSTRSTPSGEVFLSHTKLDGRYVLRLAIGNLQHDRTSRRARVGTAELGRGFQVAQPRNTRNTRINRLWSSSCSSNSRQIPGNSLNHAKPSRFSRRAVSEGHVRFT